MASAFPMLGNPVKADSLHTAAAVSASSEDYSGALARDEATERDPPQRDSGVTASGMMTENAAAQHALVESAPLPPTAPPPPLSPPSCDMHPPMPTIERLGPMFASCIHCRDLLAAGR